MSGKCIQLDRKLKHRDAIYDWNADEYDRKIIVNELITYSINWKIKIAWILKININYVINT